jgi:hypothetical protein
MNYYVNEIFDIPYNSVIIISKGRDTIVLEQKRLNVYISSKLHKDIKVYAAKTERSISDITESALKEYMEKHPAN